MNLLETLIAVAITAVIFTLTSVAFMPALDTSKVTATQTEMRSIETGFELFHIQNNRFPESFREFCRSGVVRNCDRLDAWGNEYEMRNRQFRSAGIDGRMHTRDDIVVEL